jgi:Tfp pilus assembly protein PilN
VTRQLGLELTPDEVRIARIERRFGTMRLVACERVPCTTPPERRAALAPALAWRPHVIATVLPLARLAHRMVALPFRDARRVRETVALELLGQLPVDPGDVAAGHLTLDTSGTGTRCLAALARRADVEALSALLAAAGIAPVRIDAALLGMTRLLDPATAANVALVLADGDRSAVVVYGQDRLFGLRALAARPAEDADGFAAELVWALAALGGAPRAILLGADASPDLGERIARACGMAVEPIARIVAPEWRREELAACAVAAGAAAGPGLVLDDASGGVTAVRRTRRVAALATAAGLLLAADVGLVHWRLARRDAALVAAIDATAAAALPPGTRVVAPRTQLEAAASGVAARRASAGGVLGLLRELSARLPGDVHVELDELTVDGDVLRLHGRADRFETVDVVTRSLAASTALHDVAAEESRAAVDGRGVEFGLRATWRPALGAPS